MRPRVESIYSVSESSVNAPVVGMRVSLNWCPAVTATLDSGAHVNVISGDCFRSMKNKPVLNSPGDHELLSVNDSPLSVLGIVHVPVRMAGVFLRPPVRFFVVDDLPCAVNVLLGLEFIFAHLEEINWTRRTFSLRAMRRHHHPLIVDPTSDRDTHRVHLVREGENLAAMRSAPVFVACAVTLRKRTSCLVSASVTHEPLGNSQSDQHWLFEPRPSTELAGAAGLEASVTPIEGVIPIYLENPTDRTVRIPAGFQVGSMSVATAIDSAARSVKDKMAVHPSRLGQIRIAQISAAAQAPSAKTLRLSDSVEIDLSNTINLTSGQLSRLQQMLQRNIAVFAEHPKRTPTTRLAEHRIDTGSAPPVAVAPYRVSPAQRDVIDQQVQEMLESGVIRPSNSPYSSPVLLVKKADGSDRFCVDFRKLNSITKKDFYPLPRVDDMLDALGKADYFTVLDLQSGFWQVPLHPEDREKTAFSAARGHYEFNVMPFGLCNAPATFQRAMDHLLRNFREYSSPYMDDVIIFSQGDFDVHLQHIETILQQLQSAPMVAKPVKFKVLQKELKFLGHIIAPHTIKPDPQKTAAVFAFPTPSCVRDLQSFLGLIGYYRRFVPHMATLAEPLYRLFKKNIPWRWGREEAAAMDSLKKALTSPPLMRLPNFDRDFFLCTDASGTGVGAVLSQVDENKVEHPVYFASRTLNPAERNYSTSERECLAVKWACDQFRPYLLGRPFKVYTDHAALRWLFQTKDPKSKLVRWVLALQEFDMVILPRSGRANSNADALSRLPGLLETANARSHEMIAVVTRRQTQSLPAPRHPTGMDPDLAMDDRAYDIAEAIRLSLEPVSSEGRGPMNVDKEAGEHADRTDSLRVDKGADESADQTDKVIANKEAAESADQIDSVDKEAAADRTDKGAAARVELADRTDKEASELADQTDDDEGADDSADQSEMDSLTLPAVSDDGLVAAQVQDGRAPTIPDGYLSQSESILPTAQRADQNWLPIISFLENEKTDNVAITDAVRAESRNYRLFNGVLYRQWDRTKVRPRLSTQQYRVVIPLSLRYEVLRQYHDGVCGAHLGESKTYERIADNMFWPSMYRDIIRYVQSCPNCSARKTYFHHRQTPIRSLPYPSLPFEALGIDVLGPLPKTRRKNKYILVVTDYYTRWPMAFAMKNQRAATIATILIEQVFCQHGFPATLLSDRGTNFLSELVAAVLKVFHVKKLNTTAYHPQTNGLTERFNNTLCTMLTPYTNKNQDDWDEYLPYVLFAYRTSPHHSTKQSPFYLLYGRNVRFPFDSLIGARPLDDMELSFSTAGYVEQLIEKLKIARETVDAQLRQVMERRETQNAAITNPLIFGIGDKVLLHNPVVRTGHTRKLTPPWTGPFRVIESYPNLVNYKIHQLDKSGELMKRAKSRLVHVSRLKPYVGPSTSNIRQTAMDR
jgi:hypothetical protein